MTGYDHFTGQAGDDMVDMPADAHWRNHQRRQMQALAQGIYGLFNKRRTAWATVPAKKTGQIREMRTTLASEARIHQSQMFAKEAQALEGLLVLQPPRCHERLSGVDVTAGHPHNR